MVTKTRRKPTPAEELRELRERLSWTLADFARLNNTHYEPMRRRHRVLTVETGRLRWLGLDVPTYKDPCSLAWRIDAVEYEAMRASTRAEETAR